jgi:hypothetical protein
MATEGETDKEETVQYSPDERAWKESKIVSDVFATEPPQFIPKVVYSFVKPEGMVFKKAKLELTAPGVKYSGQLMQIAPKMEWPLNGDGEGQLFTVLIADVDAPTTFQPSFRSWLHWAVVNVPLNNIEAGDTLAEYITPAPTAGSGKHRYVIAVYEQSGRFRSVDKHYSSLTDTERRAEIVLDSPTPFKDTLGTSVTVKLLAANFFLCEWDQHTAQVQAMLNVRGGGSFKIRENAKGQPTVDSDRVPEKVRKLLKDPALKAKIKAQAKAFMKARAEAAKGQEAELQRNEL